MVSDKVLAAKGEQLRDYELVVIVSPELAEEGLEATIDKISQLITAKGGAISEIERWGKRKLAYPIRHFAEGSYILARFKLGSAFTRELEANLRISDEVLRHLLVKLEAISRKPIAQEVAVKEKELEGNGKEKEG